MTTLVTGASGHLGANLVRALLARGEEVRALVRTKTPPAALEGLDVELVTGDLADEGSLKHAVRGASRLYHTAAMVSIRAGDRDALMRINVEGTRSLLRVAGDAGVKRVVHTSSFGAMGINPDGPSSEEHFLDPFAPVMDYERSKAHAELAVFQAAARGQDVVIVNPSAIIGPFDFRPSLVGKTVLDFAHGKMKAYVPGGFDWVPARDVVSGHLLAMERGRAGERYLLSGEVHSLEQVLDWLEEFTGRPRPRVAIPPRLMQSVALAKDWVEKRFFPEVAPRFNYHSIRILNSGKSGTNQKAVEELGLTPTPVRDAFRDAVTWFQESGRIPPREKLAG